MGAAVYPRPEPGRIAGDRDARSPTMSWSTPSCAAARSIPASSWSCCTALVIGRRPQLPDEAVCAECKRRGAICVVVAQGIACLGPVTRTGCGALCPAFGRGCYGCFGPRGGANVTSLVANAAGLDDSNASARFAGFTAWAEPFRSVIDAHGGPPGAAPEPPVPAGPPEPEDGMTAPPRRRRATDPAVRGRRPDAGRGRGLAAARRPATARSSRPASGSSRRRATSSGSSWAGRRTRSSTSSPASAASARSPTR